MPHKPPATASVLQYLMKFCFSRTICINLPVLPTTTRLKHMKWLHVLLIALIGCLTTLEAHPKRDPNAPTETLKVYPLKNVLDYTQGGATFMLSLTGVREEIDAFRNQLFPVPGFQTPKGQALQKSIKKQPPTLDTLNTVIKSLKANLWNEKVLHPFLLKVNLSLKEDGTVEQIGLIVVSGGSEDLPHLYAIKVLLPTEDSKKWRAVYQVRPGQDLQYDIIDEIICFSEEARRTFLNGFLISTKAKAALDKLTKVTIEVVRFETFANAMNRALNNKNLDKKVNEQTDAVWFGLLYTDPQTRQNNRFLINRWDAASRVQAQNELNERLGHDLIALSPDFTVSVVSYYPFHYNRLIDYIVPPYGGGGRPQQAAQIVAVPIPLSQEIEITRAAEAPIQTETLKFLLTYAAQFCLDQLRYMKDVTSLIRIFNECNNLDPDNTLSLSGLYTQYQEVFKRYLSGTSQSRLELYIHLIQKFEAELKSSILTLNPEMTELATEEDLIQAFHAELNEMDAVDDTISHLLVRILNKLLTENLKTVERTVSFDFTDEDFIEEEEEEDEEDKRPQTQLTQLSFNRKKIKRELAGVRTTISQQLGQIEAQADRAPTRKKVKTKNNQGLSVLSRSYQ
jgi:hypothetical protein